MEQFKLEEKLQDQNVETRLQAARELASVTLFSEPLFLIALGDVDWRVRKEAISYFMQQADAAERVEFIVAQLSHPDNAGLRNAAIEILISLGAQSVPVLLKQLSIVDAEVRKFIVDILGEIGSPDYVDDLLPYLSDEDQNVRYAVVETLGKLRSAKAADALLELLNTTDAGLQFTIFEAFTSIGKGVAVEKILPFAENSLLRKTVFGCLGQLGDVKAVPVLLDGLSDPLRKNREVALLSLGRLLKALELQEPPDCKLHCSQVVEDLYNFLEHDDVTYRRAACYVLSLCPESLIIDKLFPLLADEELQEDIVSAARLLPKSVLLDSLDSTDLKQESAVYLIFLLGELGFKEIEPFAIEGIASADPQLRYASLRTLGKIKAVSATSLIGDALTDEIPEIREAASEALGIVGEKEPLGIIKTISPYLESPDIDVRLLAVKTLGKLPKENVESYLLLALKDVAAQVRCEAVRGLSGYQSPQLLNGLSLALTDEETDVRRLAAAAIGSYPSERALPILLHALDDSEPWVRMEAIRAISGGDEKPLREIADRAISDQVGLVVIAGLEMCERLLNDASLIEKSLDHPDDDVVETAVRLLFTKQNISNLLQHERSLVRLKAIYELVRSDMPDTQELLAERQQQEQDAEVRKAIENALRKGPVRS